MSCCYNLLITQCHTSPLLVASEGGHKVIVTLLLSKGANINRQDSKVKFVIISCVDVVHVIVCVALLH